MLQVLIGLVGMYVYCAQIYLSLSFFLVRWERERERSTQGDRVLFSSVGLWEGFLTWCKDYTEPLPVISYYYYYLTYYTIILTIVTLPIISAWTCMIMEFQSGG